MTNLFRETAQCGGWDGKECCKAAPQGDINDREIEEANRKLKNGKVPGVDKTTTEIKYMREDGRRRLGDLINRVWKISAE